MLSLFLGGWPIYKNCPLRHRKLMPTLHRLGGFRQPTQTLNISKNHRGVAEVLRRHREGATEASGGDLARIRQCFQPSWPAGNESRRRTDLIAELSPRRREGVAEVWRRNTWHGFEPYFQPSRPGGKASRRCSEGVAKAMRRGSAGVAKAMRRRSEGVAKAMRRGSAGVAKG